MSELVRFSISLERGLLEKFDAALKAQRYTNRSKAIADLIRAMMVGLEWSKTGPVAGVISVVYDHHKRELVSGLIRTQHKFHGVILSTQHIHMTHSDCLEVIITRGKPEVIETLFYQIKSTKGVKYANISMATTGERL